MLYGKKIYLFAAPELSNMTKKYNLYLLSAFLYLSITSCTQNPSKEAANISINKEKPAILISEQSEPDTLKGSLKAFVEGKIGNANVKITYHSPAVRGRVVWGGLVPYDQVWVAGAHMATSFETDEELIIEGTRIPAGRYAFFTIPGKNDWIIIINKNFQQHLADDYSEKDDLFRIKIKPEIRPENQERLLYQIVSKPGNTGEIVFNWEKLKIVIPVSQ